MFRYRNDEWLDAKMKQRYSPSTETPLMKNAKPLNHVSPFYPGKCNQNRACIA